MKFTPEDFAEYIVSRFFKDSIRDELALAKIEYGLSRTLGVLLELIAAVVISLFFGTTAYIIVLMISSLSFRLFSGGSHLTSYLRCFLFTLVYFLLFSILIKYLFQNYPYILLESSIALMIILFITMFNKHIYLNIAFLINLFAIAFLLLNPQTYLASMSLTISAGIFLQAITLSNYGVIVIKFVDTQMKKIGL